MVLLILWSIIWPQPMIMLSMNIYGSAPVELKVGFYKLWYLKTAHLALLEKWQRPFEMGI